MIYGFLLLLVACFFQGSFGLGMKKYQPFSWEAFWVVFSVIGILLIPIGWTWLEVPEFMTYVRETPSKVLWLASFCGLLWGISSILFGKAVDSIGVSLTYGVNMGISASAGSLIPLLIFGNIPVARSFILLLAGMVIMLVGVVVITKAGLDKEKSFKEQLQQGQTGGAKATDKPLSKGLIMASIAGLGSAAMNIGFSYANQTLDIAAEHGVSEMSASLIPWVITLSGGFVANFLYAFIMLIKNRTYRDYVAPGSGKAYAKAIVTSFVWFFALGFYAKATVMLGPIGASVGWLAFNGLALIVSNAWGLKDGEWKGFAKSKNLLLKGNVILIASWIVVGIANGLA
ncbi:L-rhamnose/proton symporter RhaT [Paenibacillus vini]|uniref:L-rhamnose/proton symporter RhaT n=1 Tax=Paenibacillus vini TaxID=1476024 RepID=UPI0025B6914E|nr:L-rhamnose/proton symporter RhaT [Paenibacillus vini]MDN4069368.1 L-rhamnose/proton symporter RhaT [Paenibacillus vini]